MDKLRGDGVEKRVGPSMSALSLSAEHTLAGQQLYFDQHPFPGMDLENITDAGFRFLIEKNELYCAIRNLVRPGFRILDAGCGTGEFTAYLACATPGEVVGIDFSPKTVAWAKGVGARFGLEGERLRFLEKDVFSLSEADYGLFDMVLAMGLFTSIPDEDKAMKRLFDVLKPGGVAVFGFFDPVGRVYMRVKRWMLHGAADTVADRERIAHSFLLSHIEDANEKKWLVNQLIENVLNYHPPQRAVSMMEECGLVVTDCFPRPNAYGNIIPDSIMTAERYGFPAVHFLARARWLFSGTGGYYVLVGVH